MPFPTEFFAAHIRNVCIPNDATVDSTALICEMFPDPKPGTLDRIDHWRGQAWRDVEMLVLPPSVTLRTSLIGIAECGVIFPRMEDLAVAWFLPEVPWDAILELRSCPVLPSPRTLVARRLPTSITLINITNAGDFRIQIPTRNPRPDLRAGGARKFAPKLTVVSKRVQTRVEPIIYKTLVFDTCRPHADRVEAKEFTLTLRARPAECFAAHIRNLCIPERRMRRTIQLARAYWGMFDEQAVVVMGGSEHVESF